MRQIISMLCLNALLTTSLFAQTPNIKKHEFSLIVKSVLVDFRNKLVKADTPEKYEKVVDHMADYVISKSKGLEKELIEAKLESLKDFEMRKYMIAQYNQRIEDDSTNLLFLVGLCNDDWDWCFAWDYLWLWIVFGLVMLEDDVVTSDI